MRRSAQLAWVGPMAIVLAACASRPADPDVRAQAQAEGLQRIQVPGIQEAYARPGANLARYDKVLLDPIEVSFRREWNPRPGGSPVSEEDKQRIRDGLASIVQEEVTRELNASGRYQVVEAPADNVLRIDAEIRDLIVNAPDTDRPGIVRTYTLSAGEMTLDAQLRDAASGELIARVIDRERDPEQPWFEITTRVTNVAAARRAAAEWARILRRQLDAAHEMRAPG